MSSENNITHKELLTFSNLTNLDWHFVDLYNKDDEEKKRSTKLKDLLKPELFVRYDEDTDSYSYPYLEGKSGKVIKVTEEEREKGLALMRAKAGIAISTSSPGMRNSQP